ncbi:glycosyltransferase family 8 protein, partial [Hygrophoropsis aurantiaca]
MSVPYAFVTLLTSDAYLPGALTIASALKDVHEVQSSESQLKYDTVCLVTPETLDVSTINSLRGVYDVVVAVESINQKDGNRLNLLGRPDLDAVLTKLHVFRLTQYSKIIFLDADVLPVRSLSHLFSIEHEFSAVPDVGWPDIFNSGVMVLSPGEDKFVELRELLKTRGTWDGGDQGILNEWRGNNWNRLSFIYNTTPTAAYIYAPAYEQFGSNISAVHFVGSNKPWHSLSYRRAGSSSTVEAMNTTQQRIYDYGTLVDQWYSVYDRHYRPQVSLSDAEPEGKESVVADDVPPSSNHPSGGTLDLDELRRLAIKGAATLQLPHPILETTGGRGDYMTLPAVGQSDLIHRPAETSLPQEIQETNPSWPNALPDTHTGQNAQENRKEAQNNFNFEPSTPVAQTRMLPMDSPIRWTTLPTPGIDELPPAPHVRAMALPLTPLHYVPQPYKPVSQTSEPPAQQSGDPPRPLSPPLVSWNPAIEPPPKLTPNISAFPTNTYFPNVWDHSPRKSNDQPPPSALSASVSLPETTSDADAESTQPSTHTFFSPPPVPEIPEMLLRQGYYRNVTGPLHDDIPSPTPDRAKVKRVFSWEERPRHLPARVFPGEEATLPGSTFLEPTSSAEPSTPQRQILRETPALPSPLVGFPPSLQYSNSWDAVPSIQKYASRLSLPPQQSLDLGSGSPNGQRRPSNLSRTARSEASSHDGDVEDESDSDEYIKGDGSNRGKSRQRSRNSSISKKRRTYRSIGTQTIHKELRSQSVQVGTSGSPLALNKRLPRLRATSLGTRRQWPSTPGPASLPPGTAGESSEPSLSMHSPVLTLPTRLRPAGSRPGTWSPSGMSSPLALESPSPESPVQETITTPKKMINQVANSPSEGLLQQPEHASDVSTASPVSSLGPVSPPETHLPVSAGRVWDPARDVDLFKRNSEEVLTRFLKMDTWDDGQP